MATTKLAVHWSSCSFYTYFHSDLDNVFLKGVACNFCLTILYLRWDKPATLLLTSLSRMNSLDSNGKPNLIQLQLLRVFGNIPTNSCCSRYRDSGIFSTWPWPSRSCRWHLKVFPYYAVSSRKIFSASYLSYLSEPSVNNLFCGGKYIIIFGVWTKVRTVSESDDEGVQKSCS